ncbi:MAG: sensor histidine kinase [Terriglobia bacterium]
MPGSGESVESAKAVLDQAFRSFLNAAGSLEGSYGQLQSEIRRLREELEIRNCELAKSLRENEQIRAYLTHILEALPCGILVLDRHLRRRLQNPEARRLIAANLPPGRNPAGSLPVELERLLKELMSCPPGAERLWAAHSGEELRSVAITFANLPGASTSTDEFIFILRDVTEQKRLEREQESARRMKALAEMTALLAHEIRNPLASLELFASLIQGAVRGDAEASQWAVHLHAGLRGLSATVNNVLHFYTQAGPQTAALDAGELLEQTVRFLQPLALQRGMAIRWEKPAAPVFIRADAHRLQQVFFNLATNAFRAMSPGGVFSIRLEVERSEDSRAVRIEFQDQGAGITPENLPKIFEAGFTTRAGSPGLGLAVCKKVVEEHRGTLAVSSVPGEGATFTLAFPEGGHE